MEVTDTVTSKFERNLVKITHIQKKKYRFTIHSTWVKLTSLEDYDYGKNTGPRQKN